MAPFSSLMQVKRLSRQLIAPSAPSTQEVVDDGGVLLAGGEGGGVHHGWRGAHHHRVVRHVVHLRVDVLFFVTRSKTRENNIIIQKKHSLKSRHIEEKPRSLL
jgi:hypothetical protein